MFIQEERYFRAYASYFGRFVDEYRKQGIGVSMVMPQNEFNSAQVFPSCTWTPEGLARFIGYLGPEIEKRGVEIFFGTLERPKAELVEVSLRDPKASKYIKGVAFQWAGKGAIVDVRRAHREGVHGAVCTRIPRRSQTGRRIERCDVVSGLTSNTREFASNVHSGRVHDH